MKFFCIFISCFITISIIKNQHINQDNNLNEVQENITNAETNEGKNGNKKVKNVNGKEDNTNKKDEDKYKDDLNNFYDNKYTNDESNIEYIDDDKTNMTPYISLDEKIEEMKKESLNLKFGDDFKHVNEDSVNMESQGNDENYEATKKDSNKVSLKDNNEELMNNTPLKKESESKIFFDKNELKDIHKFEEVGDNKYILDLEKKLINMENIEENENENKNKKGKINHIKNMNDIKKINKKEGNNKVKKIKEKENSNNEEIDLEYKKNSNITTNNNDDKGKYEQNEQMKMHDHMNKNYENLKLKKPEFVKTFFDFLTEIFLIIKIGIIYRYTYFLIPLKNLIIYNILNQIEHFFITILSIHRTSSKQYTDIYGILLIVFFIYFLKISISKLFHSRNKKYVDTSRNRSNENLYIENLLKRILFNLEKNKNISNYENILNDILENTDNILVNINIINKENKNIYTDITSNINNIGIFTYISTQALKKINSKSDLIISELTTNRLIDDDIKMDKLKNNLINEFNDNQINKIKDDFIDEFDENDMDKLRCNAFNNDFDENEINDFLKKSGDYEFDDSINKDNFINNNINSKNEFFLKNTIDTLNDNKKIALNRVEDTRKSEYDNFNNNHLKEDYNKNNNFNNNNSDTFNVNESNAVKNNLNGYPLSEYKNEEKTNNFFNEDLNKNELTNTNNSIINKNIDVNNKVKPINNINELNKSFNNINNIYNFNSNMKNMIHTKETHNYESDLIHNQNNSTSLNVNCNTTEKNMNEDIIDKIKINSTNHIVEENLKNINENELKMNHNLINNYTNKEQVKTNDELINSISNPNVQYFDPIKKNSNLTNDNFMNKQDYMNNYVQPPYSFIPPSYQVLENSSSRNQKYITQRKERQKIVATKSPFKNIP
ncbi:secreted ookinete protein, putative [Plasmodium gallinaceum]|uniref:Secreted ookinete protein, putative n=1 Tax=Plasmodium gallinaceum TaxID=5849 RepID=A0A1J1H1H4_PLAGA|nr:secreted ookinete protein, putative [Plasmodium gallinaceum]CRG97157.1 secreted ookinete protein, putative [Plasmodium gallinaceum]